MSYFKEFISSIWIILRQNLFMMLHRPILRVIFKESIPSLHAQLPNSGNNLTKIR